MSLIRDLTFKLANAVFLLLAVVVLNFCLIHAAPGDPAEVIAGEMGGATKEVLTAIRHQYGLDRPLPAQLGSYLVHILHGDFGYSYYFNESVVKLMLQRLPATALLVIASLVIAVFVGTLLGVLSARRPNGLLSHFVSIFSLAGYAAPVFWTGLMLVVLFAAYIPLFPVNGMADVAHPKEGLAYMLDVLHHLTLPALTLGIVYIAQYSRLARTSMIDALHADYIRTARAKGLGEFIVIFKHALRNAVIPVVTMVGLQFGNLLAGAVLVETVFGWPGLGRLVFESILRRDYPTLLGVLFFSALLVMVANILTDMAYRLIDPRIRVR